MKRFLQACFLCWLACGFLYGQVAGTVGILSISQPVTYISGTSQIFQNVGQGAHYLQFCSSGGSFEGTVDLEGSYNGATNWTVLAYAAYPVALPLSGCATLQGGGYYQNIRSRITITANTVTAYYNAVAGPISYVASGIGTIGARAPLVCDQTFTDTVSDGTSVLFASTGSSSSTLRICAYSVSLDGPPTGGAIKFQAGNTVSTCSPSTPAPVWQVDTISTAPSIFGLGSGQGQLFAVNVVGYPLCVNNSSGVSATVNVSFASVSTVF
jgi:hypothetical protein